MLIDDSNEILMGYIYDLIVDAFTCHLVLVNTSYRSSKNLAKYISKIYVTFQQLKKFHFTFNFFLYKINQWV